MPVALTAAGLPRLAVVALAVATACGCGADTRSFHARAVEGVLDLRAWRPLQDGPAELSGNWWIHWGVLAPPPMPLPEPTGLFDIPGRWDGRELGGETIDTFGAATYTLRVLLPPGAPSLGVRMRSVGTAFALYANGRLVTRDGQVGPTREAMVPGRRPHVAALPDAPTLDLVLLVSNFHHRKAGPAEPFFIGPLDTLRRERQQAIAWQMFLAGALLMVGLYNLVIFALRREDLAPLYYGLFCLAIGTYTLLIGERYLMSLLPGLSWETQIRLQNLTSISALPLFFGFLRALYPAELSRMAAGAVAGCGVAILAVLAVTPARVYTQLLPVFHVAVLVGMVLTGVTLVRAVRRDREGARTMSVGIAILLVTVVNDILYDNVIIDTGQMIPLGLFLFVFSKAILLAARSARAFRTSERQSAELAVANAAYRRELGERQRAQAALAESEARLRQSQKMEAIGTLAGGVAHDFRNQLTVISGYANLIAADSTLGEAHLRRVDAILKAAERSSRLTAQLLAFSRKQLLQPEPLHLGAVVSALAPTLRRMIPEDIALLTEDRDGEVRVFADRAQAEQTIFNLCTNARDAMQGGGRLLLETASADVDPAAAEGRGAAGRYAVLRVTDTGVGMDEATASRVFDPFFTTKPVGHGTGLGLAMVYGFAQQSGGWVVVDTAPGAGSTFTVYLPATDRDDDAPHVSPAQGGASRGTETILVVEDDPFVRELEVETLSRHGYRVIASDDTDHAMRIARERDQRIDLLVTDVVMPGMSGPELSARVRELRPDLEVLFVSGYSENAVVDRGVVRSGTHLLTKPFAPDDLARMVRRVLDLRGPARESE